MSAASTDHSRHASAPAGLALHLPLILALAFAAGAEAFTTNAVSIALPRIAAGFASSPDEISWAVTLYLAAYAVFLPLTAWLSDLLGQRRLLAVAMVGYLLTSLGCALSPSLSIFLIMRTLQGAAGSVFVARALFTFTKEFRPPVLFRVAYIFIAALGLRALGLPLGGYLVDHLSWRWLFAFPVLLIGLGALPALALSTEIWPRHPKVGPDFTGLALLAAGLAALLVGLLRGQRGDWLASPLIVTLLAFAVVAVPLYFWRLGGLRERRPVFGTASLRNRGMGIGVALSFLTGLTTVGGIYVLPQFLIRIEGADAYRAGWILSVDVLATTVGLALTVAILSRFPTRALLMVSGLLFSSSMLLFAFRLTSATPVEALYLPMTLHGLAVGFALPPIGIFSFRAIGANHAHNSEGRAWHYSSRHLGGAVAVASIALLLDLRATVHSAALSANLTTLNPVAQKSIADIGRGLLSKGFPPTLSHDGAALVINRIVARESTVLAFRDVFFAATLIGPAVALLGFALPKAVRPRPAQPN